MATITMVGTTRPGIMTVIITTRTTTTEGSTALQIGRLDPLRRFAEAGTSGDLFG